MSEKGKNPVPVKNQTVIRLQVSHAKHVERQQHRCDRAVDTQKALDAAQKSHCHHHQKGIEKSFPAAWSLVLIPRKRE